MIKRIMFSCFVMGTLFCSDLEEAHAPLPPVQSRQGFHLEDMCLSKWESLAMNIDLFFSPMRVWRSQKLLRGEIASFNHEAGDAGIRVIKSHAGVQSCRTLEEAQERSVREIVRSNEACELQQAPLPPVQSRQEFHLKDMHLSKWESLAVGMFCRLSPLRVWRSKKNFSGRVSKCQS